MKIFRCFIIVLALSLLGFTTMHKYYISVTQINYIKKQASIQITSRIFIDDFENALKLNYDEKLVLDENEPDIIDTYMTKYLQDNIKLFVNEHPVTFNFIGKEYDGDVVKCYLEVEDVKHIKSLSITNSILFDLQKDQQNIVKTKINSKNKSFILSSDNLNALLKFD